MMKTAKMLCTEDFDKQQFCPAPPPSPPKHTFELGLVVAGGVSGGAYQAGVLDYLVEALDRWYAAKANGDPDVPQHDVRIKVITGTSAGGINSALLGLATAWGFQPRRVDGAVSVWGDAARDKPNIFYQTWVEGADIRHLLTTEDIQDGRPFSALNANFFAEHLVPQALQFQGAPITDTTRAYRDWLTSPLPILLTATNLTGVPYSVSFNTGADDQYQANYYMRLHKDYLSFKLTGGPGAPSERGNDCYPGYASINVWQQNKAEDPDWRRFGDAALATSAFPFGLAPVVLERPYSDYRYRVFYRDGVKKQVECIPPEPLPEAESQSYRFINVDGGVMNNEPFDLARMVLFGPEMNDAKEQALGGKTARGLLLLEAFPTDNQLDNNVDPDIVNLIGRIIGAQIDQARFKLKDLIFSRRDNLYTRFLLQPIRPGADPNGIALAGTPLEAFLGFFCRDFREHDFQLGRQNCQEFLRHRLKLPAENPVFKGDVTSDKQGLAPLVPLVGACAEDEPVPAWPRDKFKWDEQYDLHEAIKHRLDTVVRSVIRKRVGGFWGAWLCRLGWRWYFRKRAFKKIYSIVRCAEVQVNQTKSV